MDAVVSPRRAILLRCNGGAARRRGTLSEISIEPRPNPKELMAGPTALRVTLDVESSFLAPRGIAANPEVNKGDEMPEETSGPESG